MNFVRKLIGATPTDTVAQIPQGKLFLTRLPRLPKGALECLYNDALISIKKTTTRHYYQLLVIRAYEEGEAALESADEDDGDKLDSDEDEFGNSDEKLFVLAPDLKTKVHTKHDGTKVISWKDLSGDIGDRFEFVVDEAVKNTEVNHFMLAVHRCLFELKYQRSANDVPDLELSEFVYDPSADSDNERAPFERSLQLLHRNYLGSHKEPIVLSLDSEDDADDFKDATDLPVHLFLKEKCPISGQRLYEHEVELRYFDADNDVFALLSKVHVSIMQQNGYFLVLETPRYAFVAPFGQQMNPCFNYDNLACIFNLYEADTAFSLLLRFEDFAEFHRFETTFFLTLYAAVTAAAADESDKDYLADAFGRLSMDETEDGTADEYSEDAFEELAEDEDEALQKVIRGSVRDKLERKLFVSSDSEDEYGDDDEKRREATFYAGGGKNTGMSAGLANDRSYISRGDKIGVYKQGEDKLEYVTTMKNLQKGFVPDKMMLHQQDNKLLASNAASDDSRVYVVDLARGKIVELLDADDEEKLVAFGPNAKFAPLTDEQTFIGLSQNGMFRIDPRLAGKKVVKDKTFKQYKTKRNGFETLTTTKDGYLAVGSLDGGLRLYDKLGLNAKTALPALGEGFIGLDVSKDGRWLLATCRTYILLVDLKIGSGQKNAGSVGFEKPFDAAKKPVPKRLTLKPEHVLHITRATNEKIQFTRAVFNTSLQSKETTIVALTGPYVVEWSLSQIIRKKDPQLVYKIFKLPQNVVADSFVFGSQDTIITALQNDARLVQKNQFRPASKNSI